MHVLEGYERGQPVVRHFCMGCADGATPWRGGAMTADSRMRLSTLALISGLVLIVVGLFGDYLVPDRHAGFGWRQQSGLWFSVVMLLVGVLLRVDLLALAGGFLLAVAVGADWFGLISGQGIGWKQQMVIAAGGVLATAAVALRILRRIVRRAGTSAALSAGGRLSSPAA